MRLMDIDTMVGVRSALAAEMRAERNASKSGGQCRLPYTQLH